MKLATLITDEGTIFPLERRNDMLLSTLRHCVEGKGGTLELVALYPSLSRKVIARRSVRETVTLWSPFLWRPRNV